MLSQPLKLGATPLQPLRIILIMLVFSFALLPCEPAYSISGYIETNAIYFPHKEDILESRNRLLIEEKEDSKDWITLYLSGRIDGLLSNREEEKHDILAKIDEQKAQDINWNCFCASILFVEILNCETASELWGIHLRVYEVSIFLKF